VTAPGSTDRNGSDRNGSDRNGTDRNRTGDGERRGQPGGQSRPPAGGDITAGLQRWLIRSSARSMRRELTGQVRKTFGGDRDTADVWNTATTELPPEELTEAPECAWCPVCRAARQIRKSGPGLSGPLAGAGDVVAAAVQEALSAFESVLSMRPRTDPPSGRPPRPAPAPPPTPPRPTPATRAGVTPAAPTDAQAADLPPEGPDREPDDRG
jgi:hypothetical protein